MRLRSFLKMFTGKWLLATLLVIAGTFVMIRLGFWQLDRLDQRRIFNAHVLEQTSQPLLDLNEAFHGNSLKNSIAITEMEYRKVKVAGAYDFENEVALRNQVYKDQYGVHLLTPLKIEGTHYAVMVDRGWIPGNDFEVGLSAGNWANFRENGPVEVEGVIRASQTKPDFGRISDPVPAAGEERVLAWNLANLDSMQKQTPYSILPVYVQQAPDPTWTALPNRSVPDLEITEGPHLGYALQWFSFAGILFMGYPIYFYRENQVTNSKAEKTLQAVEDIGDQVNVQ